jgi:hypothetical protein
VVTAEGCTLIEPGDGVWVQRSVNLFTTMTSTTGFVAYAGNDTWVAYGADARVFRSTDNASTWVLVGIPNVGFVCNRLEYGNGVLIAADSTNQIARSTDKGLTWSAPYTISGLGVDISDLQFSVDKFYVTDTGGLFATSLDGITWTSPVYAWGAFPGMTSHNMGFGSDRIIVLGTDSGLHDDAVSVSLNDGNTWTAYDRIQPNSNLDIGEGLTSGVAFDGTYFLAPSPGTTGAGSSILMYSTDGITWISSGPAVSTLSGPVDTGRGLTALNMVPGGASRLWVSDTPTVSASWLEETPSGQIRATSLVYANDRFVAFGNEQLWTRNVCGIPGPCTPYQVTLTVQDTTGLTATILDAVWFGSSRSYLGSSGNASTGRRLHTSSDGYTWTTVTNSTGFSPTAITGHPTLYAFVASDTFWYSNAFAGPYTSGQVFSGLSTINQRSIATNGNSFVTGNSLNTSFGTFNCWRGSADGTVWVGYDLFGHTNPTHRLSSQQYAASKQTGRYYVASNTVTSNEFAMKYSDNDGVTWTPMSNPPGVASTSTRFPNLYMDTRGVNDTVLVNAMSTDGYFGLWGWDGSSWTTFNLPGSAVIGTFNREILDWGHDSDRLWIVMRDSVSGTDIIYYTTDLNNWTSPYIYTDNSEWNVNQIAALDSNIILNRNTSVTDTSVTTVDLTCFFANL